MGRFFETDQQVLSEKDFAALLAEEFPEVADELAEDDGLLHVQVGAIENLANTWIRAGDLPQLKRAFDFFAYLGRHSRQLHPNVLNAIHVSFLEGLAFEHPQYGSQAKEALPDGLLATCGRLKWHTTERSGGSGSHGSTPHSPPTPAVLTTRTMPSKNPRRQLGQYRRMVRGKRRLMPVVVLFWGVPLLLLAAALWLDWHGLWKALFALAAVSGMIQHSKERLYQKDYEKRVRELEQELSAEQRTD